MLELKRDLLQLKRDLLDRSGVVDILATLLIGKLDRHSGCILPISQIGKLTRRGVQTVCPLSRGRARAAAARAVPFRFNREAAGS